MTDPKPDVGALLDVAMDFAEGFLLKYGEFHPFGIAMSQGGDAFPIATYDGNELPTGGEALEALISVCQAEASNDKFKATAICCDINFRSNVPQGYESAIKVRLDHKQDYSAIATFPYRFKDKELDVANMIVEEGEYLIFDADQ